MLLCYVRLGSVWFDLFRISYVWLVLVWLGQEKYVRLG
jgi:hypothetical protein